ncbi:Hypothetical predicted protein [Mytilus galloprovincialis]|uniref:C-type lectin domain-containing protein n=1 Tax=Mytilus galloprovincialis TaxID=29158 RepID=A0A8B6H2D8_MYTGA|nr:Hypothetical predicted protein [Mytilus galloprovincialis]
MVSLRLLQVWLMALLFLYTSGLTIESDILAPTIVNDIVEPNTPLCNSGIVASFSIGFLFGRLTTPVMMSDGTMMAAGQMMGMNMMNAVSNLMTGSTVPPVVPMTAAASAATSPTPAQIICNCPAGFSRIPSDSGNCYLVCGSNSDWLGAVFECRKRGAYLWEPNNDAEVTAVGKAILDSTGDKFWTGATDQGNENTVTFALGSGNPFTIAAESDGASSDCVSYEPTKFIYRTCPTSRKCVCERNYCN